MQTRERQLIQDLFHRLRSAENQRRDPEVEHLIADELRRAPHATYAMAQTIIAQNQALEAAGRRIEEFENGRGEDEQDEDDESPFRNRAGGAMGAPDFGQGVGRRGSVPSFGRVPQQGGGFLANAGQVAMGVAGGMLLAEAAKSLLGGGSEAQAATPDAAAAADDGQLAQDAGANGIGGDNSGAEGGGESGGGGLFGWLFGGGENDNAGSGQESADNGVDDGGGWGGE